MSLVVECYDWYNNWVHHALSYLPNEIYDEHADRLAIIGMGHRDGVRLTPKTKEKEVIVLSDRIFPRRHAVEDQPEVRYFVYVVLHEVAHAISKHEPPDEISEEQARAQEDEADGLAMKWFNEHIAGRNNPHLLPMTEDELAGHQARTQALMKNAYDPGSA